MSDERTYTRSQLVKALQELHERAQRNPEGFQSNDVLDPERGEGVTAAIDALIDGTYDEEFGPDTDAE